MAVLHRPAPLVNAWIQAKVEFAFQVVGSSRKQDFVDGSAFFVTIVCCKHWGCRLLEGAVDWCLAGLLLPP